MTRDEVRNHVQTNLAEITDVDALVLSDNTSPEEVAGWDSVNNIKLLFAIEEELGVSFETDELVLPKNVGELLDLIHSKIQ